jgi:hypothetical protein
MSGYCSRNGGIERENGKRKKENGLKSLFHFPFSIFPEINKDRWLPKQPDGPNE